MCSAGCLVGLDYNNMRPEETMKKILLLSAAMLLVGIAQAENDVPWWRLWHSTDEVTDTSSRLFTADERRIIQSYFQDRREHRYPDGEYDSGNGNAKKKKSLPPGLQKKLARGGELPPGWQKKVARGEVLDAQLYRQSRSLPEELLRRLAIHADGTELRLLDDRVVRIMNGTRAVLDVLIVN